MYYNYKIYIINKTWKRPTFFVVWFIKRYFLLNKSTIEAHNPCIFPLVSALFPSTCFVNTSLCDRLCLACDISKETALSALLNILCGCLGLVVWLFIKSYSGVPPERTGEQGDEKNGCCADCFEDRLPVSDCHRHNQSLIAAEVIFYISYLSHQS